MDWLIVEVVIGLSFLFFLLSIVASAVSEAIAGIFKLRARVLEQGIVNLVTGSTKPAASDQSLGIVRDLYSSPLILGYGTGSGSKPSYLASRSFRNASGAGESKRRRSTAKVSRCRSRAVRG